VSGDAGAALQENRHGEGVMFRGDSHPVGLTHVFNNIFVDNNPCQSGATFFSVRDGLPSERHLHHNLFHNNIAASDTPACVGLGSG